jgi:hypothetical protein
MHGPRCTLRHRRAFLITLHSHVQTRAPVC